MNTQERREHAIAIWRAGLAAVESETLVADNIQADDERISVCQQSFEAREVERLVVIGAGKASAGMAAGVERVLRNTVWFDRLSGWVNVPEDCVSQLQRIHLHGGRPAGVNEPTEAGVFGTQKILGLVENANPSDLCLALISGGGSALLPAPVDGITLEDKRRVTKLLASRGASIHELNAVRGALSKVKAGGLARRSRAGQLIALMISDVIGDPLPVIASGPTIVDEAVDLEPLETLLSFCKRSEVPTNVMQALENRDSSNNASATTTAKITNVIIGSNSVALQAAAAEAERRGFHVIHEGSENTGVACDVGRELAGRCQTTFDLLSDSDRPVCILSGGEPTVHLAETDGPQKGGRNQELVVAALESFGQMPMTGITILSGGTDGEDGPTNAAGGFVDADIQQQTIDQGLDLESFLSANNTYPFLEQTGGLLITGPTHTNVMDLRVAIVSK